ncbi:MAG: hypothetical protein AN485_21835 [Anabaena sp. MDT14b]|nr:MAG: hypothetical protein AN485_21835 [Anabaena sp. MDT14b]
MKNNIESDFPPFGNPKSESASAQLGIISGIATTAVAGPVAGAFMGLGFASLGSIAATGACNSAVAGQNKKPDAKDVKQK